MGCLRSIGCLVVAVAIAAGAWVTRASWLPLVRHQVNGGTSGGAAASSTAAVWEPLSDSASERARTIIARLGARSGPVFANLSAGELASYLRTELARQLPPSAEGIEAAVIGDQLVVRASVRLADLGGAGALGPLGDMFGQRETVRFGGTLEVVRSGLGQFRVRSIAVRDLSLPAPLIPRVLKSVERGTRPPGVAIDALPLAIPPYIADARIRNGRITLYKAVS